MPRGLRAVALTEARPPAEDSYVEAVDLVMDISLAANTEGQGSVGIDSDADVELVALVGSKTGDYDIQVTRDLRGDTIQSSYAHDVNVVGSGNAPCPLLVPEPYRGGSVLIIKFKDTSGATNDIQIVAKCRRFYPLNSAPAA